MSPPTVDLAARRRAAVVLRSFGRIVGQRIEVGATGRGHSVVLGVRHRRPASCTVGLAVGRALERRGVPTVLGGRHPFFSGGCAPRPHRWRSRDRKASQAQPW